VEAITRIFQRNGPVEAVHLQLEPSVGPPPAAPSDPLFPSLGPDPYRLGAAFRFAYIVFAAPSSLRNAMTRMELDEPVVVSTAERPVTLGVRRWAEDYNAQFVAEERLREGIAAHMQEHDGRVAREKLAQEQLAEPDEDGWVTVAKKPEKRKPDVKKAENREEKGRGKKNRRKKKKVELTNFYSHQIKEDKMNNIRALREKFEEDKQKIAKMKQERKFRPF
jgi:ribosomal RNA-processing protein 7